MTDSLQRLRRLSLNLFLLFLSISALMAIATVLAGSFGWVEVRVLLTTFVISACSIACMACAAFAQLTGRVAVASLAGVLCLASSVLVLVGAWGEPNSDAFWKMTFISNVLAISSVHAMLLAMGRLAPEHRWVAVSGGLCIGLLALMLCVAILQEITEVNYYKLVAVVAIMVALATLAVPILHRMGQKTTAKLVLRQEHGDIFRDTHGNRFRVLALNEDKQHA